MTQLIRAAATCWSTIGSTTKPELLRRHAWWLVLVLAQTACAPSLGSVPRRYAYEPGATKRFQWSQRNETTDVLLLIGRGAQFCKRYLQTLDGEPRRKCSMLSGPAQLRIPSGSQTLEFASVDGSDKTASRYSFRFSLEPGRIYEVFHVEGPEQVDWQLHELSGEDYLKLHAQAPEEMRSFPEPPGRLRW